MFIYNKLVATIHNVGFFDDHHQLQSRNIHLLGALIHQLYQSFFQFLIFFFVQVLQLLFLDVLIQLVLLLLLDQLYLFHLEQPLEVHLFLLVEELQPFSLDQLLLQLHYFIDSFFPVYELLVFYLQAPFLELANLHFF